MRVLVACEYSGRVRDAFIRRGHDAISCDLLPAEKPGPHIQGDVSEVLRQTWDLVVAHPPCTYLSNSGVRWLHSDPDRWALMRQGAGFFLDCLNANAARVAVENPVMHKYAREIIGRGPDFTVQPWQFGDNESTAGDRVHRAPPGPDRWKDRSRTFPGIAEAIADQWSSPDLVEIMEATE